MGIRKQFDITNPDTLSVSELMINFFQGKDVVGRPIQEITLDVEHTSQVVAEVYALEKHKRVNNNIGMLDDRQCSKTHDRYCL